MQTCDGAGFDPNFAFRFGRGVEEDDGVARKLKADSCSSCGAAAGQWLWYPSEPVLDCIKQARVHPGAVTIVVSQVQAIKAPCSSTALHLGRIHWRFHRCHLQSASSVTSNIDKDGGYTPLGKQMH